jgi:hypothetical protein
LDVLNAIRHPAVCRQNISGQSGSQKERHGIEFSPWPRGTITVPIWVIALK